MILEVLVFSALLAIGLLVDEPKGSRSWNRSFALGVATYIFIHCSLTFLGLSPSPLLLLGSVLAVLCVRGLCRGFKIDVAMMILLTKGFLVFLVSSWLTRRFNLVLTTNDSYGYFEQSGLISANRLDLMDSYVAQKRMFGYPSIQSLSTSSVHGWFPGFGLTCFAATCSFIAHQVTTFIPSQKLKTLKASPFFILIACSALYAGMYLPVFAAFYANSHALIALLVTAMAAETLVRFGSRVEIAHVDLVPLSILAGAIAVTRPEGVAVCLIVILSTASLGRAQAPTQYLRMIASTSPFWGVSLLLYLFYRGITTEFPGLKAEEIGGLGYLINLVIAPISLPFAMVLLVQIRKLPRFDEQPSFPFFARLTAVFLLVTTCLLLVVDPEVQRSYWHGIYFNVVRDAGGWSNLGTLIWLVAIASAVTWVIRAQQWQLTALSLVLLSIATVNPIFASLRGGGSRLGVGDSFNRMFLHMAPLTVILVVSTFFAVRDHRSSTKVVV